MIFEEKYITCYIPLTDQILLPDYLYFYEIIVVFFTGCGIMNFEINLRFLIKQFSQLIKKVRTKIYISQESKMLLQ